MSFASASGFHVHLAGTLGGMKGHLSLLGDREEGPAPESFEDTGILGSNLILVVKLIKIYFNLKLKVMASMLGLPTWEPQNQIQGIRGVNSFVDGVLVQTLT